MPRRLPRGSESELRIQRVAEPVAQQVDAERRERERCAGERGQPPRDVEKVAALREHAAPRGRGRLDAEAEEADRGLRDDEGRELEARDDDDGGRDVRQHVPKEEAGTAHPERRGRLHEIALLDRQHLAAHDASIHDPPRSRKAEVDVPAPVPGGLRLAAKSVVSGSRGASHGAATAATTTATVRPMPSHALRWFTVVAGALSPRPWMA